MRAASVEGLTPDGLTVLVRVDGDDGELVRVPLAEVRRAQRTAPTLPLGGGPTPRQVQERIRAGETAEDIARSCGLPVGDVARYEGPVLAERAHQADRARTAEVDGRRVEELVVEHLGRLVPPGTPVLWDSRQTDPNRWEVTADADGVSVLLAWDPRARRVDPVDDGARQAFGYAPPPDVLEQVLRPVRRQPRAARPEPTAAPPRRGRAQVPLWDDIGAEVGGGRLADPGPG
ncbi:MAG TPA: septation protein SepH [Mycobacteriales bacterium]|nr:septation protein SepH [Mycobacteriales bacterium]